MFSSHEYAYSLDLVLSLGVSICNLDVVNRFSDHYPVVFNVNLSSVCRSSSLNVV